MDNPDKQAIFGTRQCFTKEALEKRDYHECTN
jgi:hypothetical protein